MTVFETNAHRHEPNRHDQRLHTPTMAGTPKILLAKPPSSAAAAARFGRDDDPAAAGHRARNAPQPGSLNLLSDSHEFHTDRVLPFLTENSDFVVVGIMGPPGVGKSTIMNELYGFDGSSPGMLPPFATHSEDTRAMAKHCTTGIELRVSAERIILLDAHPVFSPSLLIDIMRPDGSSSISVMNGEIIPADLALELMGIQLMLTVDLLKHGIPDPSVFTSAHSQASNTGPDKENKSNDHTGSEDFSAALVFVHSKLRNQDASSSNNLLLKKAASKFFNSTFKVSKTEKTGEISSSSSNMLTEEANSVLPDLFLLPLKVVDNVQRPQYESHSSALGKLRDQILSMSGHPFAKNITERDWLRSSARIWELIKKSPVIADYCRTLQSSGIFRK